MKPDTGAGSALLAINDIGIIQWKGPKAIEVIKDSILEERRQAVDTHRGFLVTFQLFAKAIFAYGNRDHLPELQASLSIAFQHIQFTF